MNNSIFVEEKFKRSKSKDSEPLKFIPVNLHLEKFLVDSSQLSTVNKLVKKKRLAYDFTSVGAFTNVHVERNPLPRSVEVLMNCEQQNEYSPRSQIIQNEIVLVFYSLKVFTTILNILKLIKESEDKIKVIVQF